MVTPQRIRGRILANKRRKPVRTPDFVNQALCSAEALLQVATFGKRANSVHRAGALFAASFTVY